MSIAARLARLEKSLRPGRETLDSLTPDELIAAGDVFMAEDTSHPLYRRTLIRYGGLQLRGRRFEHVPQDEIDAAMQRLADQLGPDAMSEGDDE